IDEYLNSIEELTIKYKDKIIIKKAFEFEYIGNHDDYLYMMKDKVDYMIIGQHFKFIDSYSYDQLTNDEDVLEYAQAIVEACDKGLVDIIAHPDYFMLGRRDFSKACIEAANMIGAAAKRNNVIVEINLNGLRYGKYKYKEGLLYPYPFRNLYIELEKYNLKYIYGYDAHKPITLLEEERITTVNEILKGINLNIINELGE
ncbi:MAG: histidinol phosphate phosphatase, partial [Erysipelotrichaceae bacterium]